MKHIPTRVVITILTFIIGITITANWWSRTNKRFADDIYFPAGTFSPHEEGLNWLAKYYSSSLAAMQELPLSSLKGEDAETYRFLWLRSFHPPVSIRLWRSGRQNYMSTKKLSGTGTPKNGEAVFPKTLAVNETRSLTEEEWKNFQELLRKAEFWSMPTVDNAPLGLDGAGWLLEGVKPDQYHVVHRQSPERGAYREVCVYLLGISRVKIDESKGELY